jgi:hypothetical protein
MIKRFECAPDNAERRWPFGGLQLQETAPHRGAGRRLCPVLVPCQVHKRPIRANATQR